MVEAIALEIPKVFRQKVHQLQYFIVQDVQTLVEKENLYFYVPIMSKLICHVGISTITIFQLYPTNAQERLTETLLKPWSMHTAEFLEPKNLFLMDGVIFMFETLCLLVSNPLYLKFRVFNNSELKGAPYLAKKCTKRSTNFFPSKHHIFGKRRTIF